MRPQTIYIITAVLAAFVFSLTMSMSFKNDSKGPGFIRKPVANRIDLSVGSLLESQSYSGITSVPGITVVKPAKKKEPVTELANIEPLTDKQDSTYIKGSDSSAKASSAAKNTNNEGQDDSSGITELNKRPPEKETREMNQHGIMMW